MSRTSLFDRIRAASSPEEGMTMVEMAVAMMLMAIAATIYLGSMTSVYSGVNRQQRRSEINDEARNAIEQIDRAVRSGDILYAATDSIPAPGCGTFNGTGLACTPDFSIRVYTQYNATTPTSTMDSSGHRCVQYLIQGQRLLRRSWTPVTRAAVGPWRSIATNIVNQDLSPPVPAFVREPGDRILDVTVLVNNRLGKSDAPRTVRIQSSIAVRNYGVGDPCTPIPSAAT